MTEKHRVGPDGILEDGTRLIPVTRQDFVLYDQAQQSLSHLSAPVLLHTDNPHERLFIANFDGTGNDAEHDPGHITTIGVFQSVLETLTNQNPHIASQYISGPGTQSHLLSRIADSALGYTYDRRVETMYGLFIRQVRQWREEDPDVQIRVVATGFSRGAEQAAGFTRLVHERGIQDPAGEKIHHHLFRSNTVTYNTPPLVAPGQIPQAVILIDPVGTGRPHSRDRQLPPSVVSGFQLTARDERRDAFPETLIIPLGTSDDGRFLDVTVPGAHSDLGGSYHHDGLAILNRNMAVDYLNALSDTPLLQKQAEPQDLQHYMIHRSEDHQVFYGTRYVREHGERAERGVQIGAPDCRATLACLPPEPVDAAMAAQLADRHPVSIAPLPSPPQAVSTLMQTAVEPPLEQQRLQELQQLQELLRWQRHPHMHDQATLQQREPMQGVEAATAHRVDVSAITSHSSIDDMFEALYQATVTEDHAAISAVSQAYRESQHGQAFLQMGRDYNQQREMEQQTIQQKMVRQGPAMSR
ncbi:T6SS phospholipase effector Tle1-like catalytic domain-containing protein [Dyella nitratireducens]|uniref:T6SS Phospholipase effector Tle1-like catalytic domain-containing protein n=1 Tax=Dyella nitratireducens TaxID=1849580 RepID=A0ABQ1FM41_9GAMM|nr:DUF2235 domain-containing protein [Dyella nitratireducens]GGA22161.1 hypothetical protein GCM10010981_07940 [Dyella nitratireducens]GLQ44146.1 hypothetical protein GCM10007902_39960 [Dyella nitratireducens]